MKKYFCKKIVGNEFGPFKSEGYEYLVVTDGGNIFFLNTDGVLESKKENNSLSVHDISDHVKYGAWLEIKEASAFRMLDIKAVAPEYKFEELKAAFYRIDYEKLRANDKMKPFIEDTKSNKSPLLFRHCRLYHEDGSVRGNGGFSLGIVIDHDNMTLQVYPAICDDADTFSKHTAIKLIEYRHQVGDGFKVHYDSFVSLVKNVEFGLDSTFDVSNYKIVAPLIRKLSEYQDF